MTTDWSAIISRRYQRPHDLAWIGLLGEQLRIVLAGNLPRDDAPEQRELRLYRAIDKHGTPVDFLLTAKRDLQAAKCLLRKLLKKQRRSPRVLITEAQGPETDRETGKDQTSASILVRMTR